MRNVIFYSAYGIETVEFDVLTINTIELYDHPFLNAHLQPCTQWKWLSIPVERHRYLDTPNILHFMRHFTEKLEHVIVKIIWSGNDDICRKTISRLNYVM